MGTIDAADAEWLRKAVQEMNAFQAALRIGESVDPLWRGWSLGRKIATIRRGRGLTQRELAERAGLPQSQVSRIESGRDFKMSSLLRLFAALKYELVVLPKDLKGSDPFDPF